MSFIRTLSVKGLVLGGAISAEDRRERIRLAIYQQRLDAAPFDANTNFAQAYELCYNRPLDLRRISRGSPQRIIDVGEADEECVSEYDDSDLDDEAIAMGGQ